MFTLNHQDIIKTCIWHHNSAIVDHPDPLLPTLPPTISGLAPLASLVRSFPLIFFFFFSVFFVFTSNKYLLFFLACNCRHLLTKTATPPPSLVRLLH
ncbi:hypothetical protein L6452_05768 [Arctium lappa]|uniref:Uncharacterized protein n=1 Tax=Arctium lappa TaxID=4217 RepID=A0ACB9EHL6_ARCLA|nr:hypothetical protein L6452_05768 [Arctium lappa]